MNRALKLLERVLTQNIYQRNIASYRGLVELDHLGREIQKPPSQDADLIRLWAFASAKAKGENSGILFLYSQKSGALSVEPFYEISANGF